MVTFRASVPNNTGISTTTASRYAGSGNEGTVLFTYPGVSVMDFQVWGRATPSDPWALLAQATGSTVAGSLTFPLTPFLGFALGSPDLTDPVEMVFLETAQCCC